MVHRQYNYNNFIVEIKSYILIIFLGCYLVKKARVIYRRRNAAVFMIGSAGFIYTATMNSAGGRGIVKVTLEKPRASPVLHYLNATNLLRALAAWPACA
jgi:hypothetical protein